MGWLFLAVGIVFEVAGTTSMKLSDGFANPVPSVLVFVFYAFSFVALMFALKHIDLSIAYAIWAGVGTAVVAAIGVMMFNEPMSLFKGLCIGLVIAGVIGLRAAESAPH